MSLLALSAAAVVLVKHELTLHRQRLGSEQAVLGGAALGGGRLGPASFLPAGSRQQLYW